MINKFKPLWVMAVIWLLTACSGQTARSEPLTTPTTSHFDTSEQIATVKPENNITSVKTGDIVIPSTYQINLQGKTEAGDFNDIKAILEITFGPASDPNSILVAIYPEDPTLENLAMGHFFWQSYTAELPTADEHVSQVTVNGNQVTMTVNPSDTFRSDVMWFTQVTGTLAEIPGMQGQSGRIGAMAQTGTLSFQVEGNSLSGDMTISGTSDMGTPSTYTATFNGEAL